MSKEINLAINIKNNLTGLMNNFYRLKQDLQMWVDLALSGNITDEDLEGIGITAAEFTAIMSSIEALETFLITNNHSDNFNKLIIS
jgi:hypothetical protein